MTRSGPLPMPERMGPTERYLADVHAFMEGYDRMEPQMQEIIQTYGSKMALDVCRANYGRWHRCEEILEARRKTKEEERLLGLKTARIS